MKHIKMLGLLAVAAMALAALGAGSASATTLEVEGIEQNESVVITGGLAPETSLVMSNTGGSPLGSCTSGSSTGSTTSPYTGTSVTGAGSSLEGVSCSRPITVHKSGTISVTHIEGTTDGTIISSGAEVTISTEFGAINCKLPSGSHVGVLTGKEGGEAVVDVNAVVSCGFPLSTATVKGTGVITSPEGLGVSE